LTCKPRRGHHGGAQGIGYAVAERMLKSGAAVALWDINGEQLARRAAIAGRTGQGCDARWPNSPTKRRSTTHAG